MNKAILSGTALAFLFEEISGKFTEIKLKESPLLDEQEVGVMTDLEKAIYTAMETKRQEMESEFEKITGIKSDMGEEEKEKLKAAFGEPTNEQLATMSKLKTERELLHDLLFSLIKSRIYEASRADTIRLCPGYKIVTGTSHEVFMSKLFGGHGFTVIEIGVGKKV